MPTGEHFDNLIAALDPIIDWRLDETEGTTAVDSGSLGLDGTHTNGPTVGQEGYFDGDLAVSYASASSQYTTNTSVGTTNLPLSGVAIFKVASAHNGTILALTNTTDSGYAAMRVEAGGKLRAQARMTASPNTTFQADSVENIPLDEWCLGVCRVSPDTVQVSLNGADFVSVEHNIQIINMLRFSVGALNRVGIALPLSGSVARAAIIRGAVTQEDVDRLYQAFLGNEPAAASETTFPFPVAGWQRQEVEFPAPAGVSERFGYFATPLCNADLSLVNVQDYYPAAPAKHMRLVSTDHATTAGGVYAQFFDDDPTEVVAQHLVIPDATYGGVVFSQMETGFPFVRQLDDKIVATAHGGRSTGGQETLLFAPGDDITATWDYLGVAIPATTAEHTGYASAAYIDGELYFVSLAKGATSREYRLAHSSDGTGINAAAVTPDFKGFINQTPGTAVADEDAYGIDPRGRFVISGGRIYRVTTRGYLAIGATGIGRGDLVAYAEPSPEEAEIRDRVYGWQRGSVHVLADHLDVFPEDDGELFFPAIYKIGSTWWMDASGRTSTTTQQLIYRASTSPPTLYGGGLGIGLGL